jgi:uncharacterized C2H2 Zn-finger protein
MDPVNKFASFNTTAPELLARILKPRVEKSLSENQAASAQLAFKEWSKLFKHEILKHENDEHQSPKEDPSVFQCNKCDKTFSSQQALGGHSSKSHPGSSQKYNKKIVVRQGREYEREMLKQAKKMIEAIGKNPKLFRADCTKIKNLLI